MSEPPYSDEDDDDATTTVRHADAVGLANNGQITINEVIRNIRKRKNRKQMPSTARRNEQRRQRRRTGAPQPQPLEAGHQVAQAEPASPPPPEEEEPDTAVVAPQLTLDENGNIVVDSSSLVVSAGTVINAETEGGDVTTFENYEYTKHITSATFSKRQNSTKWLAEETDRFYECLRKYGTDFLLMESDFPTRSRRQLKLKFKREERENPCRIDNALRATPLPLPTSLPKRPAAPDDQQTENTSREEQDTPPDAAGDTPPAPDLTATAPASHSQKIADVQAAQAQANDASDTEVKDDENSDNEATREAVIKVVGTADDDPDMQDVDMNAMPLITAESDDSWGDSD